MTAKPGTPCPQGCTTEQCGVEVPVYLEVAEFVDDESGRVVRDPYGSVVCPSCWTWFGYDEEEG